MKNVYALLFDLVFIAFGLALLLAALQHVLLHSPFARKKPQATVLIKQFLAEEWLTGGDLRKKLREAGMSLSYECFSLLMVELEKEKVVEGYDRPDFTARTNLQVRWYRLPVASVT
ncbi:MAG: hypothetical protein Q7R93_00255 [bacterium]|nr:hypothetical protein [bacterium]